ncbi:MAG TPA: universal stress protein [Lysobacter sp.]|nr:universal stress protein [Lysobacter sp.]
MSTASQSPYIHAAGNVLAAVDQSGYTESVCRHAVWAATRMGAPLQLVHALPRVQSASPRDLSGNLALGEQESLLLTLSAEDERRSALAQQNGRALLQQARGIANDAGISEVETRLRHGGLAENLLELEQDVRLFVLGKRGEDAPSDHERLDAAPLGHELEGVVRAVHRPLLVAPREFRPIQRVLIAFDGSPTTRKGVQMVAASPLFHAADIHVVAVGSAQDAGARELPWAEQILAEAGFGPRVARIEGVAEAVLCEYTREHHIDLLVMGAYGHSRIRDLIVGSTTTAMLRRCHIPVLLLR